MVLKWSEVEFEFNFDKASAFYKASIFQFLNLDISLMLTRMLAKKFRGCLLGALAGDCFGAPYEGEDQSNISKTQLQSYFDKLEGPPYKSKLLR